jgi:glycosyltransferase involved in cell wall biosynthesis
LTEQKGVMSLIRIIDAINGTDSKEKIVFNIIGSGQLEEEIVKLKRKWDNVNWFGYVEYCFLPSIYNKNDIFISTSKWESLPFNILEAQAVGLPVIAFNIPGPQDIINNKKSGFLVETEREFCERIRCMITGTYGFDRNEIKDAINRIFNPESIYLKLFKMIQNVVGSE